MAAPILPPDRIYNYHPSSQGMVCVKGATIAESLDKGRLHYPMVRDSLNEEFRRLSWNEAFDLITQRIQTLRLNQATDSICMYGSGQFQTEDYYIAQKLLKGCLGTVYILIYAFIQLINALHLVHIILKV